MKKMIDPAYAEYASYIKALGKGKLLHAQGNVLLMAEAGKFDVVVQGCNCFNAMGGGIAREIRQRYPEVALVDSNTVRGDYNKLGTYTEGYAWFNTQKGDDSDNFIIVNAYTQYNMSSGEDVFEYEAFALILKKLAHQYPTHKFGFPYIGMGLAGGDKNRILPMLEAFANQISSTNGSVTLVEFK
jgi:O-acetyl-ADP-ribose deacetylase (regulator of RNase III)